MAHTPSSVPHTAYATTDTASIGSHDGAATTRPAGRPASPQATATPPPPPPPANRPYMPSDGPSLVPWLTGSLYWLLAREFP